MWFLPMCVLLILFLIPWILAVIITINCSVQILRLHFLAENNSTWVNNDSIFWTVIVSRVMCWGGRVGRVDISGNCSQWVAEVCCLSWMDWVCEAVRLVTSPFFKMLMTKPQYYNVNRFFLSISHTLSVWRLTSAVV